MEIRLYGTNSTLTMIARATIPCTTPPTALRWRDRFFTMVAMDPNTAEPIYWEKTVFMITDEPGNFLTPIATAEAKQ